MVKFSSKELRDIFDDYDREVDLDRVKSYGLRLGQCIVVMQDEVEKLSELIKLMAKKLDDKCEGV